MENNILPTYLGRRGIIAYTRYDDHSLVHHEGVIVDISPSGIADGRHSCATVTVRRDDGGHFTSGLQNLTLLDEPESVE